MIVQIATIASSRPNINISRDTSYDLNWFFVLLIYPDIRNQPQWPWFCVDRNVVSSQATTESVRYIQYLVLSVTNIMQTSTANLKSPKLPPLTRKRLSVERNRDNINSDFLQHQPDRGNLLYCVPQVQHCPSPRAFEQQQRVTPSTPLWQKLALCAVLMLGFIAVTTLTLGILGLILIISMNVVRGM